MGGTSRAGNHRCFNGAFCQKEVEHVRRDRGVGALPRQREILRNVRHAYSVVSCAGNSPGALERGKRPGSLQEATDPADPDRNAIRLAAHARASHSGLPRYFATARALVPTAFTAATSWSFRDVPLIAPPPDLPVLVHVHL